MSMRLFTSRGGDRPAIGAIRARVAIAAIAAIGLMLATPAFAQGTTWVGFPNADGPSQRVEIDRNFVKEWESAPPKGFPTLSKQNLAAMAAAIKLYENVVAKGGFPAVPEDQQLNVGMFLPTVALVKQRLAMSADLRESDSDVSQNFDYGLEKAVKRFQASNGLSPTGVIDKRTMAALNVNLGRNWVSSHHILYRPAYWPNI